MNPDFRPCKAYTDGQVDLKVSNVNRVSTAPRSPCKLCRVKTWAAALNVGDRSDEAKGTQHVPTTFPEMY
eukprot:6155763-Amphidinium_carterae.1